LFRPVPLKQWRCAVASATGAFAFVTARGHSIDRLPEIPFVVDERVENVSKTKDAVALLKGIRVYGDVKHVIDGKCHRSPKGKMPPSAFKTKCEPLVVYQTDGGVVKAFRTSPVDVNRFANGNCAVEMPYVFHPPSSDKQSLFLRRWRREDKEGFVRAEWQRNRA
jgi:ribosomal protein L4